MMSGDHDATVSFRDVFDHSTSPMAVLRGPEHVVVLMNDRYRSALGDRAVLGQPVWTAFPAVDADSLNLVLDRVYATDESADLADTLVTFTCQPLHDASGGVDGVLLQAIDLTTAERDRAVTDAEARADTLREANQQLVVAGLHEQELAEEADVAQRRASFLAEASRQLAASFDYEATLRDVAALAVPTIADYCLVDVVASGGEISRVGWANADPAELVTFDDVRRHTPTWEFKSHPIVQALETGRPVVVSEVNEAWRRAAATSAEHLRTLRALDFRSLMTVPIVAGDRRLGAMTFCITARSGRRYQSEDLALAEDLTGRAALAIENARLYRELQLALRLREDFLTTTAHDLRNPLTSIRGFAQLWRRRATQADAAKPLSSVALVESMEHIERTVNTMTRMIEGLMDAARLQAGHALELVERPVDLVALVQRMAEDAQRGGAVGPIRVEAASPRLVGLWDGARLERVVGNLIANAVKYSPDGGAVDITLRTTEEGGWAELAVRDEGIGIPVADLPWLFEWFHRGENVVGRIPGMGIGLAGARAIVEQHGGTIAVESQEGKGSTFTVRLPVGSPEA